MARKKKRGDEPTDDAFRSVIDEPAEVAKPRSSYRLKVVDRRTGKVTTRKTTKATKGKVVGVGEEMSVRPPFRNPYRQEDIPDLNDKGTVEDLVERLAAREAELADWEAPDLDDINAQRAEHGLEPLPDDYEFKRPQVIYTEHEPLA